MNGLIHAGYASNTNLIYADFSPEYLNLVHKMLKEIGAVRMMEYLETEGEHPSFVKCIVKKAMKRKGW